MVDIIDGDLVFKDENTKNAKGGTELIAQGIVDHVPKEHLDGVQIIHSKIRGLEEDKKKILVVHDLPTDPESEYLRDGGWNDFDKIVFVSNWQQQMFNMMLGVPYSEGIVINNAVKPFNFPKKDFTTRPIKLIYTSTPQRGLNILYPVFDALSKDYDVELDVYSSFNLYGWESGDEKFKELFEKLDEHPKINNHGTVPNSEIREAVKNSHVFAYPSIWPETSCLCLIEAMMTKNFCVHPNYAALPETSGGMTIQYGFNEDLNEHAGIFYNNLVHIVHNIEHNWNPLVENSLDVMRVRAEMLFGWDRAMNSWIQLLKEVKKDD